MAIISASEFFGGKLPEQPTPTTRNTPAEPAPAGGYVQGVKDAARAGIDKAKQGVADISTATNPVQLLEGAVKEGAGIIDTASSPLAPIFSPLGKLLGYMSDKLSDHPAVQKFAMSPAGETASRVAEDIGNVNTIASAVAGVKVAPNVASVAAKAGAAGADAAAHVAADAASGAGTLLKTAGEKATGVGVNMEVPTRQALQAYQATKPTLVDRVSGLFTGAKDTSTATKPITEANTAVRLLQPGTEWQLGVNAKKISGTLWSDTIEPALNASRNVNHMPTFLSDIRSQIIKGTADLDRRKVLLKAWQSFADDYKNVRTFSDKKLQQYKEGWAQFVPEKSYKGEPIAAASKEVRAVAADTARNVLYKILPDGAAKQAYIDYGNLKSISEAGIKSVDALRSKGVSRQVWEAVMDKAVTPIATVAGKVLYKTGEGLEFLGEKGAKKVRDIVQPR